MELFLITPHHRFHLDRHARHTRLVNPIVLNSAHRTPQITFPLPSLWTTLAENIPQVQAITPTLTRKRLTQLLPHLPHQSVARTTVPIDIPQQLVRTLSYLAGPRMDIIATPSPPTDLEVNTQNHAPIRIVQTTAPITITTTLALHQRAHP